jgi:hypothetical protein
MWGYFKGGHTAITVTTEEEQQVLRLALKVYQYELRRLKRGNTAEFRLLKKMIAQLER